MISTMNEDAPQTDAGAVELTKYTKKADDLVSMAWSINTKKKHIYNTINEFINGSGMHNDLNIE